MSKLGLIIPNYYLPMFIDKTGYLVVEGNKLALFLDAFEKFDEKEEIRKKEIILHNGYITKQTYKSVDVNKIITNYKTLIEKRFCVSHIFSPESDNKREHYAMHNEFIEAVEKENIIKKTKIIIIHKGIQLEYQKLKAIRRYNQNIEIGLRWDSVFRRNFLTAEDAKDTIYISYRNTEELIKRPPKILITAIPFQYAMMGICLKERTRKQKYQILETQFTMNESQIRLANTNIDILRNYI